MSYINSYINLPYVKGNFPFSFPQLLCWVCQNICQLVYLHWQTGEIRALLRKTTQAFHWLLNICQWIITFPHFKFELDSSSAFAFNANICYLKQEIKVETTIKYATENVHVLFFCFAQTSDLLYFIFRKYGSRCYEGRQMYGHFSNVIEPKSSEL